MLYLIVKYLITALVIVVVSELAKRSDQFGAFIASLPMVTIMTLIWLHVEQQSLEKIANHAFYTFWYVIPTLPMFITFPYLLAKFEFWYALLIGVVITVGSLIGFTIVLKRFSINLM
jgi:F0F1-type ATP synthase assembly protein I